MSRKDVLLRRTNIKKKKKAWNLAPKDFKVKVNIYGAKAAIKKFVKTLPI